MDSLITQINVLLVSFPCSPSPFHKFNHTRNLRAWYRATPWPGYALHHLLYHTRAGGMWIVITLLTGHEGPLRESNIM